MLYDITETQMQELERQFEQQDQQGWRDRTESYGSSDEEAVVVWNWFGMQPEGQR